MSPVHDLGPLWCLHDTPVAVRFHTDSLVAFQNKTETEYAREMPGQGHHLAVGDI